MRSGVIRRASALLAALALCLSVGPSATAAGPIDYALYTDIVAVIDGHPLRSYNIGGYTAVVAEDLRGYGFWVVWNAAERTLTISRAMRDGEVETPELWPTYEPEKLTRRIGARAKGVYATDIVTYAAGGVLDSFNINGETLVWMDDLAPFGSVEWHPEERVISLTLGDPVEIALRSMTGSVEEWKAAAGSGSGWETYACKTGTLLVTRYTGTPHGGSTQMTFLRKNGDRLSINDLLPHYIWGSGYYLAPDEIEIDEPGYRLRFVTPVLEMENWPESGDVKALGRCKCAVDLLSGRLLSLEPLSNGINWELTLSMPGETELGQTLSLTVERAGAQVTAAEGTFPGRELVISMDSSGVRIVHEAALLLSAAFEATDYHAAYQALRELGLPDVAAGDGMTNTPEQRAAASRYFQLTLNGEPVNGSLWWSRGNNHTDLNYTFDEPLLLSDGDVLLLTMGG